MTTAFRPRTLVLFVGDIVFFAFSLWLSLFLRVSQAPSQELFMAHLRPFSLLFVVWAAVFFVAGLYESRSIIMARSALSNTLLAAQVTNVILAALFFFFVPLFGIAPKTLLFIYLAVSFCLVLSWRAFVFPLFWLRKPEPVVIIGGGQELVEIKEALAAAHRPPIKIVEHARGVESVDLIFLYEEMFGRIPLSQVDEVWLARNASRYAHTLYDPVKRIIDLAITLPAGVLSLLFYPFIMLAIKLEDGGKAIISMPRVGKGARTFDMYKFRSMSGNDKGEYGAGGATKLKVTKVGKFLRNTRLDELPQLWNVIAGNLSLVGPRPEVPSLSARYENEIPFYRARYLVKPGLSGSAQLYYHGDPHGMADVEATRMKLAYDLFYLKHRSLSLDLSIILKTIRRLLVKSNA